MVSPLLYKHYNIPTSYIGVTYSDTDLSKAKQEHIETKVKSAPKKGTLVVRGTAAPIINQLLDAGRIVQGIDFVERSSSAFDTHYNPSADVIILYGLGLEISVNHNVSRQVLQNILAYYAKRDTLVVIETGLTKSELRNNYDFIPVNFLQVPEAAEESWV